jgi:hypothetical protein
MLLLHHHHHPFFRHLAAEVAAWYTEHLPAPLPHQPTIN